MPLDIDPAERSNIQSRDLKKCYTGRQAHTDLGPHIQNGLYSEVALAKYFKYILLSHDQSALLTVLLLKITNSKSQILILLRVVWSTIIGFSKNTFGNCPDKIKRY